MSPLRPLNLPKLWQLSSVLLDEARRAQEKMHVDADATCRCSFTISIKHPAGADFTAWQAFAGGCNRARLSAGVQWCSSDEKCSQQPA